MLDDQSTIARFDTSNALAVAAGSAEQLIYNSPDSKVTGLGSIQNIVLAGMGGSALAGLLVRDWLDDELSIPLIITRDYSLPKFVSENTLVIVSSYSGNTEEALSALKDAQSNNAQIIIITAGGKLAEIAKAQEYPLLSIPADYQPRMTTGFGIRLLADAFHSLGLIGDKSQELKSAHEFLAAAAKAYLPQVKTADNQAKHMALELAGKIAVIYGSPSLASAAYKWKISINENAKNLAFCNQLPEFNHNEFIGWSGKPVEKPLAVVELSSSLDHPQIGRRYEVSNRLLSGKMPKPIKVQAQGQTKLEQILWIVQLGDFVSIYLAILNQVNPTPVELVEKLKKDL